MNHFLVVEDVADSVAWLSARLRAVWGDDIHVDAASTLAQARQKLASESYDVVLVDLGLPDGSGIELLQEQEAGSTRFIVATIYDDDEHLFGALRAGAHGYLLKERPAGDIEASLRGLRDGMPPLSSAIAVRMMEFFSAPKPAPTDNPLTERERDVLVLIAKGMSVAEAADSLGISAHTARGYVKDIYRKLGISSRAEASLRASRLGLIRE